MHTMCCSTLFNVDWLIKGSAGSLFSHKHTSFSQKNTQVRFLGHSLQISNAVICAISPQGSSANMWKQLQALCALWVSIIYYLRSMQSWERHSSAVIHLSDYESNINHAKGTHFEYRVSVSKLIQFILSQWRDFIINSFCFTGKNILFLCAKTH